MTLIQYLEKPASYTNKGGMPMTVPVIEGEMESFILSRLTDIHI